MSLFARPSRFVRSKLNLGELSGVGRTAFKRVTPLASAVGAAADFASPLGNYSDYLSWITGAATFALLIYWLSFRQRAKSEEVEASIIPKALIYCGASAVIFTGISISKASADTSDTGLIASHVPALANLQKSLFRLEETAKEMNTKLDRIEDNVNQLKKVYTIEQIQKLEEQEIWEDVITHLEDIDPLKRDDEWQRLLENSVYEYMRDLDRRQEHQKAGEVANDVFEKYKTLKRSDRAMKLRNKLLIHRIKACYQSREPMEDCRPRALGMIEYHPKYRAEMGFEVGKLVTYYRWHRAALPFFDIALQEDAREDYCAEERLALAVVNGFGGSDTDPDTKLAPLLANKCFPHIKDALAKELSANPKGTRFADALCAIFKSNKAKHSHCK
ncbi:MAG: hypothetical protein H6624_02745 [Bdellovibrionaceae bacterium]|nr:hypothetical protein [Bdellovibrionales bacterium]MCB9083230.1 hypothetical protein [Pseudobdellovibrionaceae bacterium]